MDNTRDYIYIKGAKENNLKNIDVVVPKNKLVIATGISGSGKTSLAFDTLYQEGQRRYIESLSSYARQFLGSFEKPNVESIEGLSPSISIDQRTTSANPRSTVGTVTEIYDYLRLLYARIGIPYNPVTGQPITKQTILEMATRVMEYKEDTKIYILSPMVKREKGTHKKLFEELIKEGFERVLLDKELLLIEEIPELDKNKNHDISVVIDRIKLNHLEATKSRVYESLELACSKSNGLAQILVDDKDLILFSEHYNITDLDFSIPVLEHRLFSFNTPLGACPHCNGLGVKLTISEDLLLLKDKSFNNGGLLSNKNFEEGNLSNQEIAQIAKIYDIDLDIPIAQIPREKLDIILYGTKDHKINYTIKSNGNHTYEKNNFEGVITNLNRRYMETTSDWIRTWVEQYMTEEICPVCNGARLNKAALSVKVGTLNISELTSMSIDKILDYFNNLILNNEQKLISESILSEIKNRLSFLLDVGLEYLTLSRNAGTLSGGEAQRIRLATQIGSKLTGVLYVLDEPSIGLHQKDNQRLINTLKKMRDIGNTLVVVEHDLDTMRQSDYIIDIGPYAGENGGYLVAAGSPKEIEDNPNSITGAYLSGRKTIPYNIKRRTKKGEIIIVGAKENNLKDITVNIPTSVLNVITGVSGSGKSTLVNEILYKGLASKLYATKDKVGKHDYIIDNGNIDKIIEISQSPIGRTPRSNSATYTGVFDDIRDLYSLTTEAKARGYQKGRFSFNVKGGRCEACAGDGVKRIQMHFLPDVYVPCEACKGTRYNSETLQIKYKGKNIADVLKMKVIDALAFFENHPKIHYKLQALHDCGLDYISLGQSATTLSGGEAQRVKLAAELYKKSNDKTLYILDEPTTGLHSYDVEKLLEVFNKIVDNGSTMVIIEHNLDIIKNADYIIDLGPDGGDKGGYVVCAGTPEEIAKCEKSYTGAYLKGILNE
ncbi:MAG: excinuclease ABC subunit UvrA [Acholeplasmatales bacterium]|jgi:excinuclease ABC subunit A|nr:excinuclease ABC subunit UvrA [Acholeplasmatales bacterium]